MPQITKNQLRAQLEHLQNIGVLDDIIEIVHQHPSRHLTPPLLLALGSRETNLQNIEGDGGHGKGAWQYDTRSHADWLKQQPGVKSGNWSTAERGKTAWAVGYVPAYKPSLKRALDILAYNIEKARDAGTVTEGKVVRTAVAGWNAGIAGAIRAVKSTGDPDSGTTGKDYSADVFRRRDLIEEILEEMGL